MHVKMHLQLILTKFGGVLSLYVIEDVEKLKTCIYTSNTNLYKINYNLNVS